MSLHSRRAILTSIAALTAGLAGCSISDDGESSSTTTEPSGQFTGSSTDPATATIRRPAGGSVVRSSRRTPDPDRGDYLTTAWAIRSTEAADALAFGDAENVAAARSLLSGTDFDTETVVCQQYLSEACLRRRVEHVRWGPSAVAIDYRTVEADDCDVDETDAEATLVRVPTPLSDGLGYFAASVGDD